MTLSTMTRIRSTSKALADTIAADRGWTRTEALKRLVEAGALALGYDHEGRPAELPAPARRRAARLVRGSGRSARGKVDAEARTQ